ncbi:MAG: GTP 3',8-cyclase MoaA, partial [Acidimicrobiia bacterium]|nr:GTP 3',8-cyclase MoaA [Acidimicrobiia bacterium]
LFATSGTDLRELIRSGATDEQLDAAIGRVWSVRRDRYSELRTEQTVRIRPKVEMSYIGG